MKNLLLACAAVATLFGIESARAADMEPKAAPVYKAPAMTPAYSWTGFYVGGTAGGAWGSFDPTTSTVFTSTGFFDPTSPPAIAAVGAQRIKPAGVTGGIEAGYNWQTGPVVFGLEADFGYFGLRGNASGTGVYPCCAPNTFTVSSSAKTDWLFTARPRIGIANNNWLFYVTGGAAVTDLHGNFTFTDTFGATESGSISSTRVGWTAGAGVEAGLWDHWTLKAEYLFVDFGTVSITSTNLNVGDNPFTHSVSLKANIARVGVNYRFW